MWAGYETSYTFQTAKNGSNTAYASNYDVTISEITWSVPGNQNYEGYVRIGGKGLSNVDRVISSKGTISADISKITFNHGGRSHNSLTVNSVKLTVASNSDFSTIIEEITVTPTIAVSTAGSFDFKAGDSSASITSWGANRYYKFTINVSNSNNSSNYGFDVKSIVFYNYVESGKTTTSLAWSANTYSFYQGDAYTLPTLTPSPAAIASDITYNSSNTAVASIAANGTVTINGLGSTIITASYAGDATYEAATDASYTLNVYGIFTTMAELQAGCAAYGNNSMKGKMTFSNVYVTAVKGNNAYVSDGTNGAVIYKSSHGFAAGDKLASTALEMTMLNYNGYTPEITSLTKTTDGLTVTSGNEITPTALAVDAITTANFGTLVKITNVTYDATNKVFKDASDHTIAYYDNFTAGPTLNDGEEYDVTGVILFKNSTTVEICPRTADDVVAKAVKTIPTSNWKVGSNVVTSIAVTKGGTVSATFETNSTGTKSFASSDETVATVSNTGVISLGNAGIATITATTEANDTYYSSSTPLTVIVGEAVEDGIFNFGNYQDYGSGVVPTSENVYVEEEKTWTAGDITLTTNGKIRWFIGANGLDLKLYSKKVSEVETTKFTIAAPSGKKLTKFVITGSSFGSMTADKGTYTSGTWTGLEDDVTLTYGGSGTIGISTITVYYSAPTISVTLPAAGYMTYCNVGAALDFTGIKAYKVSAVGETSVTLQEITAAPANTPVILEATEGAHNLSVLASADAVGTNKLKVSDGTKTTTAEKIVYALAKKNSTVGFYKVQAGVTVPEGKCYIEVNAPANNAPEFLGFGGEATGINEVSSSKIQVSGNEVYNLAGQRVAQPTKGLYIVNGKKVIIK